MKSTARTDRSVWSASGAEGSVVGRAHLDHVFEIGESPLDLTQLLVNPDGLHGREVGVYSLDDVLTFDRGEAETIAVARETGAICATDDGPAIRCCRALGISFTSAIGLLAAIAEAEVVEPALALELLAKLQRFGKYDARILEDVARWIRAAPSSRKGGGPP